MSEGAASDAERLDADDLFALQYIRAGCLSADGRWVAYALSHTNGAEHFEILIAALETGEKRRLPYAGNATAPAWSPDGTRIAFVGDGRLRLAEFSSLAVTEPLTPAGLSVEGKPSWSPDSRRIAVCLCERREITGPRRIVDDVFRVDGIGFLDQLTQRIFEITVADGAQRCLTPGNDFCSQPLWSPTGERILFLARAAAVAFATGSQRLGMVNAGDGAITEVLGQGWYVESARWLCDGERIVAAAAKDSMLTVPTLSLWVVHASSKQAQLRTPGLIAHIGVRLNHDMPARELTSSNGLAIAADDCAFVSVQKGGRVEICRVALDGDIAVAPIVGGERTCIVLDSHRESATVLYATTDLHTPLELALVSARDVRERQLTHLNGSVLARWPRIVTETFTFKSADGLEIDTWFMSLAERKSPVPTVLFIHAGPFMAAGHAFRYDFHHLASHGYGVLFANFRGSAGYGEEFVRAISGDWGARAYPDHMGAVDAAIERGYADPKRLGVWGPSHGGFATCWIVGHTSRFKAAVAEAAITDFATLYYHTDVPETFCRELGGRPHEIPDVYRSRSPITYAHRCKTPTLLVHGEDDLRCPISQAEQFYRLLREVGCPTELLRIPSCSHIGDSIGPLSARRAQNEALVAWFDRYL